MSDSQEKYGPEKDEPEQPPPQPPASENSGGPRREVEGQRQAPPVQIKCSSGDEVNPTPPATSTWTPTPGPSCEPNIISKPTSWHFRPVDETRARQYDKIFQEEEMNQAFSRPNQGLSIREGGGQSIRERGGQSIRREIIDVSKIGHLRKTNDPTKIKGWRRKFGTGITFSPSSRTNTPNPSEPQKKISESPESPPKKITESPESPPKKITESPESPPKKITESPASPPKKITESPESPPKKMPRMQLKEPAEDSRRESNLSEGEEDAPLDELVDFMLDEEDVETPVEWILPPPEERELEVPEAGTSRQAHIELLRNEEMIKRILINTLNNLQFDTRKFHGDMLEIRSSNKLATVNPASDKKWKYTDRVLVEASPNAVRINVAAEDIRHHVEEIGEDFLPKGWYGITLTVCDPIEGYDVALHVARDSGAETSRIVNIVLCLLEMIINIINEMKSAQP
ncbi:serine/arginine repetitive matrix protein 1-like [Nilaparvata lugens]|uniref:serine/arginine repetitive matrix protein 1-like n=1 Tax=Nilaparvata lugens TaxID=108931 RepID=UPI00193D02A7|nr:serine/arginine repetitive matrix protein 1-like [Nilaparvata lugens]